VHVDPAGGSFLGAGTARSPAARSTRRSFASLLDPVVDL
jgi:hypothetical protein